VKRSYKIRIRRNKLTSHLLLSSTIFLWSCSHPKSEHKNWKDRTKFSTTLSKEAFRAKINNTSQKTTHQEKSVAPVLNMKLRITLIFNLNREACLLFLHPNFAPYIRLLYPYHFSYINNSFRPFATTALNYFSISTKCIKTIFNFWNKSLLFIPPKIKINVYCQKRIQRVTVNLSLIMKKNGVE